MNCQRIIQPLTSPNSCCKSHLAPHESRRSRSERTRILFINGPQPVTFNIHTLRKPIPFCPPRFTVKNSCILFLIANNISPDHQLFLLLFTSFIALNNINVLHRCTRWTFYLSPFVYVKIKDGLCGTNEFTLKKTLCGLYMLSNSRVFLPQGV